MVSVSGKVYLAMKTKVAEPIYILIGRNILAVTFLFAACAKWLQLSQFVGTLTASGLVSLSLAPFVSILIIVMELTAGIGLLIPSLRTQALYVLLMLLPAFLFYSIWRQVQHIEVPCSCFGPLFKIDPIPSALLDAGLLGLTLLILRFQYQLQRNRRPDPCLSDPNPPAAVADYTKG
ncbi:MAG TPA: MauE/DoxX family redox-associated membrane protein [Chthonomonadaceae bacterium]|nr:MauE/DoxX family redox-associated membrane protein [Chthonomonadaceae bacterium]